MTAKTTSAPAMRAALAGTRALLLDMDGVIVSAGQLIPGAADAIGRLARAVRRRRLEVGTVEEQEPVRRLGADVVAVLGQDGGQPGSLAWAFDRIDLSVAPSGIHDDEPDQTGSHHQPDDEQPDIELGIHRGEV